MLILQDRHRQIFHFVLAGAMSAVLEIGSFKIFSLYLPKIFPPEYNLGGIRYPFSNVFSTLLGIVSNYFFSIWFVFERGKHSKKREFAYFMLISGMSTLLSLFFFQIFYAFVIKDHIDVGFFVFSQEIISKCLAIGTASVLNFYVKKKFIFNG